MALPWAAAFSPRVPNRRSSPRQALTPKSEFDLDLRSRSSYPNVCSRTIRIRDSRLATSEPRISPRGFGCRARRASRRRGAPRAGAAPRHRDAGHGSPASPGATRGARRRAGRDGAPRVAEHLHRVRLATGRVRRSLERSERSSRAAPAPGTASSAFPGHATAAHVVGVARCWPPSSPTTRSAETLWTTAPRNQGGARAAQSQASAPSSRAIALDSLLSASFFEASRRTLAKSPSFAAETKSPRTSACSSAITTKRSA